MNLKTLSKRCKWPSARLAIALIGIAVLLLICLTACKSRRDAACNYRRDAACHVSTNATRNYRRDAACHVSTTTHDTIAILHTETLWREPDSLGKIYPLVTIKQEQSAKRTALKQTKVTKVDTIHITDNTDHTSSVETRHDNETRHVTSLRWLPWVLLAGVVVIISRRIQ